MLQQHSPSFKAHDKSQPTWLEKTKLKLSPTHCQAEPKLATVRLNTVLSKKMLIYHKEFTLESHNLAFSPLSGLFFNFGDTIYFYSVVCVNGGNLGRELKNMYLCSLYTMYRVQIILWAHTYININHYTQRYCRVKRNHGRSTCFESTGLIMYCCSSLCMWITSSTNHLYYRELSDLEGLFVL